jgi:AraC family transcriptional regulator, exoenzyme S synthesis regulatory protein ExsA
MYNLYSKMSTDKSNPKQLGCGENFTTYFTCQYDGNPANTKLLNCFGSIMNEPHKTSLQRVMEENYCYNLRLEDFARLATRSLSAFKRDFFRVYKTTPGKWLIERRLDHALHLLTHTDKTVSETAFESGFESASHFSRVFRQRFGVSPVSMRRQKVA